MGFSMAQHLVLERLNKLVAKGYVVRWGESEQDTVRLQHPRAPNLTLFFGRENMGSNCVS